MEISNNITKLLLIVCFAMFLASVFGCSAEKDCKTCQAEFINVNTGEVIHQEADCERVPHAEGFVFVKCVSNPGY